VPERARASRLAVGGFALLLLLLGACSAAPLDPSPPQGFDLAGDWVLQADLSDAAPGPHQLEAPPPPIPGSSRGNRGGRQSPRGGLAFVAHDFPVLKARRMTIEQNPDSMGIEYDRGRYRDVSWGERTRGLWTVQAGWDDAGELVIRSDASDAKAVERYLLSSNGETLTVLVRIDAGSQKVDVQRVYTRRP
jgi:hypothetical protein